MKIAIISKSDRFSGGASRVAEDLALWLNEAGHQADHLIAFSNQEPLSFQQSLYGTGLKFKLCRKIHSITNRYGFRELLPVEYWLNLSQIIQTYDLLHFHDLYSAISPFTLALVSRRKPTFFTVHDCSAFTGGCLYPIECHKFKSYCHQCPQLPQDTWFARLRDHTREIQSIQRWLAKHSQIRYIFPSQWISQNGNLALSFKIPPVIIPYGIDLKFFNEQTKEKAKAALNLPQGRKIVAISANYLAASHKGVRYAIAALQSCRDLSPLVLAVGHCNDELREVCQGLDLREMGFLSNPKRLAQAYLASDLMLFCSLADNLPLTILEAMAASTVIVGFATGGVPEMIQNGRNGILVEPTNQEALNQALRQALSSNDITTMGQQARQDVENNFSQSLFLQKHIELYQELEEFSLSKSTTPEQILSV
ncbi:glycosyltransferase [Chroococcus sp. FPU101]|uniref:glycosyltransferase n=1 Tax=Chroococcus sp. FPU101 TaxID=1974212 RepID=UPI001A8FAA23|nr:glycosyltransferase [Chroococcus sp. FPU101]GFE68207.1 group 1 glycosyl transferase [Chroococcus sp. FPU101]